MSLTKIIHIQGYKISDNPIFSIQETVNRGAAFGVFNEMPKFLGFLGIVVLIGAIIYVIKNLKENDNRNILLSSVFSAGVLGNTAERLTNGYVFDFIKLNFIDFPIFNIFDVLVSCSVFLYIIFCIKSEIEKRKKA